MKAKILSHALSAVILINGHLVEAQQPKKIPRIGFLSLLVGPSPLEEAFLQGLHDLGYVEGQNIAIEYRWAAQGGTSP